MEDLNSFNDEKLQMMAAQGSSAAEDALAARYIRLVRVCARPYFLAGGDSEDLTQEGMLGLLSAIRTYDQTREASFKSFAELCIRRRIVSAVKSAGRMKHSPLNNGVSLEEALDEENSAPNAPSVEVFRRTPEEQVLAKERADEFFHIFSQQLSSLEQQILTLYLDGCTYRDMAMETGKDTKAIDNAVQRIRRKLIRSTYFGDISES